MSLKIAFAAVMKRCTPVEDFLRMLALVSF